MIVVATVAFVAVVRYKVGVVRVVAFCAAVGLVASAFS